MVKKTSLSKHPKKKPVRLSNERLKKVAGGTTYGGFASAVSVNTIGAAGTLAKNSTVAKKVLIGSLGRTRIK